MNFTVDQIKYTPFYIHEKKKTSRKLNGYHVYVSNAFKNFKDLGDEEKMELIRPALRGTILERLEESNVLQPDFDHVNGDPFLLAPFSPSDFKSDIKKVVNYHWHNLTPEMKSAWNSRATWLNSRPVTGEFNNIPHRILSTNGSTCTAVKEILRRDCETLRRKFAQCYKRSVKNPDGLYKKKEHIYADLTVFNKFYFYDSIPYAMFKALFGDKFKNMFMDSEQNGHGMFKKSEFRGDEDSSNKCISTFHIFSRERLKSIFLVEDVNLALHTSYEEVDEVQHSLCSLISMREVGARRSGDIMGYGWTESNEETLVVHFNSTDSTSVSDAEFELPFYNKRYIGRTENGTDQFKHEYICAPHRSKISTCGRYEWKSFEPAIIQINRNKLTLKLIASRACKVVGEIVFNKSLSSA